MISCVGSGINPAMARMSLKVRRANVSRNIPCLRWTQIDRTAHMVRLEPGQTTSGKGRVFQRRNDEMKAKFVAATLTMFFYGLALAIFML